MKYSHTFPYIFVGLMSVKHSLDRETTDFYNITISVYDSHKSTNASLPIFVLDINDNSPVFERPSYSVEWYEGEIGDNLQFFIILH